MKKISFIDFIIVTISVFVFVSCKKENETIQKSIVKNDKNHKEAQKPYYEMKPCLTDDDEDGILCQACLWQPTYQCSLPHPCIALSELESLFPSTMSYEKVEDLFDEMLADYGSFENIPLTKSNVLHYWNLFQFLYEKGEMITTPQNLYDNAREE